MCVVYCIILVLLLLSVDLFERMETIKNVLFGARGTQEPSASRHFVEYHETVTVIPVRSFIVFPSDGVF